jgi:hypothetical protein
MHNYAAITRIATDIRGMWECAVAGPDGQVETAGSCLYAAILLVIAFEKFAGASAQVCGGGADEGAGLRDSNYIFRGHYWVEGLTAEGVAFIADITADQFGYPKVVIAHPDEARAQYRQGDPALVRHHVEMEMRAIAETRNESVENATTFGGRGARPRQA